MRRRILLYFMSVILLIVILFQAIFTFAIYHYYYGNIEETIRQHAQTSRSFFDQYHPLYTFDLKEYSSEIIHSFQMTGTNLLLLNSRGEVVQSSSGLAVEKKVNIPTFLKEGGTLKDIVYSPLGEKVMTFYQPLFHQDQVIGYLCYETSLTDIDKMILRFTVITLVLNLIIASAAFILSWRLSNSFLKPIQHIISISSKMAKGQFQNRIETKSPDELGHLALTLNYMADEIQENERLKNEFISSISHELRTPLTGIKGWAETLKDPDYLSKEEIAQGMGIISSETDRLIHLVEDLLDFSRLQANRITLLKHTFDLNELLEEIVFHWKIKAQEKQILLTYSGDCAVFWGDENRLKQVFLNIIDNAVKYTGTKGEVKVTLQKFKKAVSVKICDNGQGISEEHIPHISKTFYQADMKHNGAGIGLAIAYNIVALHGGKIDVNSEEGIGTEVVVILPFLEA
ncbi:sensor histidine kinase [Priestia endophytica]|uniref:sensor histidine kinase n=1 Tax=Priestia endophytica TaxID=135735 RepID=UPI00227E911B|nr:HAMP domain-containing sensor histidine kinase [Priestia endophytica]MCY8235047.1 HAMP domain-containing histidine kinase [Priestia endophytica]